MESTISVKRTVASTRSPGPSGATPTIRALVHSTVTHGSSPTTQASWPGGISKTESGRYVEPLAVVHDDVQDAGHRVAEVMRLASSGSP